MIRPMQSPQMGATPGGKGQPARLPNVPNSVPFGEKPLPNQISPESLFSDPGLGQPRQFQPVRGNPRGASANLGLRQQQLQQQQASQQPQRGGSDMVTHQAFLDRANFFSDPYNTGQDVPAISAPSVPTPQQATNSMPNINTVAAQGINDAIDGARQEMNYQPLSINAQNYTPSNVDGFGYLSANSVGRGYGSNNAQAQGFNAACVNSRGYNAAQTGI